MVRVLAILLQNDFAHNPTSHVIPIFLFMVCTIGVVIFNCGHKAKARPPPTSNMMYYGPGGSAYGYPVKAGGGRGGGGGRMGGAALGLAAGAGVGLAAGLAVDAVVDAADKGSGGGGCGGGGGGCGGGGCGGGGCGGGCGG